MANGRIVDSGGSPLTRDKSCESAGYPLSLEL